MKPTVETLLSILDALHMGITVVDENNRTVVMNRTFGEMVQENAGQLQGQDHT